MTDTRTFTIRELIYAEVDAERDRQDEKFGLADPSVLSGDNEWKKLAVLGEEYGEIARALLEHSFGADTIEHIEQELVQVAAVAIAWLEFARHKRHGWSQPPRWVLVACAWRDCGQQHEFGEENWRPLIGDEHEHWA